MNDVTQIECATDRPLASRILVVASDHQDIRRFESALAPLRRELAIAPSHQAALRQLAEETIALVVMNVGDTDGFEAAIQIRATAPDSDTAILLVTGLAPERGGR